MLYFFLVQPQNKSKTKISFELISENEKKSLKDFKKTIESIDLFGPHSYL